MRGAVLLVAVGLLAGCSTGATSSSQEPVAAPPSSSAPSPADPSSPSPTSASPTSPGIEVTVCAPEAAAGMAATISGQQAAFAEGDFARARSFASDGFRSGVTVDEFQTIIEREYGFLLDDPAIDVEKCAQVERVGEVQVRVAGSVERTMIYRLVRERGTWAIDGARVTSAPSGIAA